MDPSSLAGRVVELESPPGALRTCVVLGSLGRGGSADCFLARDPLGRHLVIKAARADGPPSAAIGLEVEDRILAELRTARVVRRLGRVRWPAGTAYAFERLFANPLLAGSDEEVRRHFPERGTRYLSLPPPVALSLARDLFQGLDHLHAEGYVHHDVKLGNFMVRLPAREQRAELSPADVLAHAFAGRARGVLIDLGGARSAAYLAELNRGEAARDQTLVPPQLTPLYAPPEALLEVPSPWGPRSLLLPSLDVYAAGLVTYALVTGRAAYDHVAGDAHETSRLVALKEDERRGRLEPLDGAALLHAPGYEDQAARLFALLRDCTHRDPQRRPTAAEARRRIDALCGDLRLALQADPGRAGGADDRRNAKSPEGERGGNPDDRRSAQSPERERGGNPDDGPAEPRRPPTVVAPTVSWAALRPEPRRSSPTRRLPPPDLPPNRSRGGVVTRVARRPTPRPEQAGRRPSGRQPRPATEAPRRSRRPSRPEPPPLPTRPPRPASGRHRAAGAPSASGRHRPGDAPSASGRQPATDAQPAAQPDPRPQPGPNAGAPRPSGRLGRVVRIERPAVPKKSRRAS